MTQPTEVAMPCRGSQGQRAAVAACPSHIPTLIHDEVRTRLARLAPGYPRSRGAFTPDLRTLRDQGQGGSEPSERCPLRQCLTLAATEHSFPHQSRYLPHPDSVPSRKRVKQVSSRLFLFVSGQRRDMPEASSRKPRLLVVHHPL